MRKINTKWKSTPGNFDPLHTLEPMESDNDWGIPRVEGTPAIPVFSWSQTFDHFRTTVRLKRQIPDGEGLVHFFTEDYRFEQCWSYPDRFVAYMSPEHWTTTPDFSCYTDHPPAVHLWNIFRSRWLGAYWQKSGLQVIPTVTWATPASYSYCFLGLPKESTLAVSTVGVLKDPHARELWKQGFNEMADRLNPSFVVCYGALPDGFTSMGVPMQILEPFYGRFPLNQSKARSRPRLRPTRAK